MFPLRARRWRTILDPVAPKLPLGPLWRSMAIGMMVNNVVPLRAGEFARAFALTREVPAVSFSTALASLVVDRVFDAIVVLLLLAVGVVVAATSPPATTIGGYSLVARSRSSSPRRRSPARRALRAGVLSRNTHSSYSNWSRGACRRRSSGAAARCSAASPRD